MLRGRAVLVLLVGCGFQVPAPAGGPTDGAAPDDTGGDGAVPDGAPGDAAPDATPPDAALPVTTDHPSAADTFLASDLPASVFSDQISALADGDIQRTALFRFDLSTISTTSVVTGAELVIWTDFDAGGPCTLYPVLQAWDEATATWNVRTAGTNWTAAGAAPPSRGTSAIGTVNPGTADTAYTITLDTATVAGWVTSPGTNFGLAIITTESNGTRFSTKEKPETARRPVLRVTHVP